MINSLRMRSHGLAAVVVASAIVLACSACSGGGGGAGPDAAAHYHNTGGSMEGVCAAFNNTDLFNQAEDESGLAKYWDAIAENAPAEISAKVFIVAQMVDKEAKGDFSGLTDANSATNKEVTDWMVAHCES